MVSNRISRALLPAAFGMLLAVPAHSQEVQLFTWTGRVDRDVRITVQPGNVSNSTESSISNRARVSVNTRMPAQEGSLRVAVNRGRGTVNVIQQPNASNGYTAVIDVNDSQGGQDGYSLTAFWTPTGGRMYGNRDPRYDRNRRESGGDYIGNAPALHWSGDVDTGVELVWRNGNVTQRMMRGGGVRNVSSSVSGNNMGTGAVSVNLRSGRGNVEVVQQPSADNRYTTIIRIVDPAGGYGHYSLDAYWR